MAAGRTAGVENEDRELGRSSHPREGEGLERALAPKLQTQLQLQLSLGKC